MFSLVSFCKHSPGPVSCTWNSKYRNFPGGGDAVRFTAEKACTFSLLSLAAFARLILAVVENVSEVRCRDELFRDWREFMLVLLEAWEGNSARHRMVSVTEPPLGVNFSELDSRFITTWRMRWTSLAAKVSLMLCWPTTRLTQTKPYRAFFRCRQDRCIAVFLTRRQVRWRHPRILFLK